MSRSIRDRQHVTGSVFILPLTALERNTAFPRSLILNVTIIADSTSADTSLLQNRTNHGALDVPSTSREAMTWARIYDSS